MAAMSSEGDGVIYAIDVVRSCIGRDLQPLTEECRSHFTQTPSGSFFLRQLLYDRLIGGCIVSPSAVFYAPVFLQCPEVSPRSSQDTRLRNDEDHETGRSLFQPFSMQFPMAAIGNSPKRTSRQNIGLFLSFLGKIYGRI